MKKQIILYLFVLIASTGYAQSDKIIDHSTLTASGLKTIFENAYLQVVSEKENFILVKDTYSIYVTLYDKNKRYIEFVIFNNFKDGVSLMDKYEFTNKVNQDLIEVTAYCDKEQNQAVFKYDLWIEGNVTAGDIIKAFKAFQNTLTASVLRDTKHILK